MTTEWAHLPNAALIDAVLADSAARPEVWDADHDAVWGEAHGKARDATLAAARTAAWNAAWDAVQGMGRAATWDAAWVAVWGTALGAAWDAIYTLIAWDDCAHLLDLPSDTLRTMADLCEAPVCHQAALLLPYVLVKEST